MALATLAHLGIWHALNLPLEAEDVAPRVAGFAYNAFGRWDSPLAGRLPSTQRLADDLALLARHTDRLRTYSAAEFPELPALAQANGLRLTLGVWLDRRADNNAREMAAALAAARQPGVERVIAGNETQLHKKLEPAALYAHLDQLRKALRPHKIPVSTAEPWHVWLDQPELVRHVDFITVHLLPYWEGVPAEAALEVALRRYDELRARFPKKPIVIGEIGWPSHGETFASGYGEAEANPAAQAQFVRAFLAVAAERKLDYYLMEAIDQPWKRATEGAVGAHWGMFDADRQAKFAFTGAVFSDPDWQAKAAWALGFGVLLGLPVLFALPNLHLAGRIAYAVSAQAVAAGGVLLATLPLADYLRPQDFAALVLLAPALLLMAAIVLAQSFEFAELFWPGSLRRLAPPRPLPAGTPAPFVSIHLACCNEPPAMVMCTIDSLLALDWPAFEIIVVDNNTRDPSLWRPVRRHVLRRLRERRLAGKSGPSLHFHHLPQWPGFKAGALNFALEHTDPRAEWVAVVDADYVVRPDWLASVAGYFTRPQVGIVQCPQAHRDWQGSLTQRMMNWEYDGFFRIGMHHRHERDAIIQHGTMTLIRARALQEAGGWETRCIVEDSELGLRLLAQRWQAIYVDAVLGTGLVPADFAAYCRQRRRWAEGAMQILRRHARVLLGRSRLSLGQRFHFIAGWLPWLGDALHLLFSLAALAWTAAYLFRPDVIDLPLPFYAAPLAALLLVRLLAGPLLYWRRVFCPAVDIAGAAIAGMGLSHSIARGVLAGLTGGHAVFHVTRRSGSTTWATAPLAAHEETVLLLALLAAVGALILQPGAADLATRVWMALLALQALPYAAAVACAMLSRRDAQQVRERLPAVPPAPTFQAK